MKRGAQEQVFTGWHMLAVMLAFFGVIIAVNVTMAVLANRSWTGFVVQNTYVASQQFNAKMAETRAQAALGWAGDLSVQDGHPRYGLRDRAGRPVALSGVTLTFMRPVDDRDDQSIPLVATGDGTFGTDVTIADGAWIVEIEADAGLDKPFRERRRILVSQGAKS